MKRLNRKYLFAVALLVTCFVFSVHGQQEAIQTKLDYTNLELKITSSKQEFIQLEPIPITLTLNNPTNQIIKSEAVLYFSAGRVSMYVRREGSTSFTKTRRLSPSFEYLVGRERDIAPGNKIELTQLIEIELNSIFPQPGTYQLQAGFRTRNGIEEIRSNILTVQINAPTGIDKEAFDFIKTKTNPSSFLIGLDLFRNEQVQNMLKDFVSTFGSSTYGPYATYHLGLFYHVRKDYLNARNEFSKLNSKTDFFYHDDVTKRLIDIEKCLKEN